MTNAILRGKPDAGNPHVRFNEGKVASYPPVEGVAMGGTKPRRGSLRDKHLAIVILMLLMAGDVVAAKKEPAVTENYDWREGSALTVEGRGFPQTETPLVRLPNRWKAQVTPAVWNLSQTSIGFNTRFVTDSNEIVVRWTVRSSLKPLEQIPFEGHAGVDVYRRAAGGTWEHVKAFGPDPASGRGEARVPWRPGDEALVYLPIRTAPQTFSVGVKKGKSFKTAPAHGVAKPIVHYGTSIVNGGGVSRGGLVFSSRMGRLVDAEVVNLGFSGSGKMELPMADLVAEIDASLYIIDCDWNMSRPVQEANYELFMRRLKELRPDTPILVCGGCTDQNVPRAQEIFAKGILDKLRAEAPAKWANMTFLTGVGMLPQDSECTHDHCHPNDYGAMQMSKVYAEAVSRILRRGDSPRKAQ